MAFSSGTTGQPKPAAYSHEQVLLAMDSMVPAFPDLDESSRLVCWLPLANLFQRMINLSAVVAGVPSYIVSDPRTVMDHVPKVEPDLLIGVPRFFERVHGAIQSRMAQQNPIVRRLTRWALAAGTRQAMASTMSVTPNWWDAARFGVADHMVLARLRAVFGTRMRYLVSGSAPMAPWLHDFYDAIGLPIYEAYGMSENVTPIAFNRPGARKRGTVGRPVASNDIRLGEDGEVLVRGPGLSGGDWSAIDWRPGSSFEGYWPTGDLGSFDEEGYLRLTGRKADAFKTGLGRWVMPADVEAALRAIAQVDHVVVVGVGRPGVAAVVVLSAPIADAALISAIEQSSLALPVYQRPLGVIVTSRSFTIEDGELTTNLKLRRKAIETSFQGAIDRLYIAIQAARAQSSDGAATAKIVLHREP